MELTVHIVILINQTKKDLEAEISQSRLNYWLKHAVVESLEYSDVWCKLHHILNWSKEMSLARTLAGEVDISGPCLIATPVKVVLGMRDSECHLLDKDSSLISQAQLNSFNEFFTDIFQLHFCRDGHYLLEFESQPEFHLEKHYWPPYLGDYREQVHAAKGELVKHLTEMQTWCYQQSSLWNALYLWSEDTKSGLPSVKIEECTQNNSFELLKLLERDNETDHDIQIITLDNFIGFEKKFAELENQCLSGEIEKISVSFSDKDIFRIDLQTLKPWWKKLLPF